MSRSELIAIEATKLPEPLQREVYDFARFLGLKNEEGSFNGLWMTRPCHLWITNR